MQPASVDRRRSGTTAFGFRLASTIRGTLEGTGGFLRRKDAATNQSFVSSRLLAATIKNFVVTSSSSSSSFFITPDGSTI